MIAEQILKDRIMDMERTKEHIFKTRIGTYPKESRMWVGQIDDKINMVKESLLILKLI